MSCVCYWWGVVSITKISTDTTVLACMALLTRARGVDLREWMQCSGRGGGGEWLSDSSEEICAELCHFHGLTQYLVFLPIELVEHFQSKGEMFCACVRGDHAVERTCSDYQSIFVCFSYKFCCKFRPTGRQNDLIQCVSVSR